MRRVSFAVALLQEPELLILDEPTVGVDPVLREKYVRSEIHAIMWLWSEIWRMDELYIHDCSYTDGLHKSMVSIPLLEKFVQMTQYIFMIMSGILYKM